MKQKASMNRTIVLTDEDKARYAERLGARFVEGQNCIICDDFNNINQQLPNEYARLIIIDPPYNINKTYGSTTFKAMSDTEYREYILKILYNCLRVLKKDGTLYICGDWRSSYIQRKALEILESKSECYVINRITWARDKGRGAANNWKNNIEDIYMVVKNKTDYVFNIDAVKMKKTVVATYKDKNGNNKDWTTDASGENYRMTHPSNIWSDITVPFWSMPENTDHPTQKPEKLYAKLILASSNPGDIVYEPYAGVCTGCVTAEKLGRKWLGVEIEPEYCMLGMKRIEMAIADKTIQGFEDGIFRTK